MALILCLETTTTNCSVALSNHGSVIAFKEDNNNQYSHAERLHAYIQDVINASGYALSDLNAVAVSRPGSYTGLRIGFRRLKDCVLRRKSL